MDFERLKWIKKRKRSGCSSSPTILQEQHNKSEAKNNTINGITQQITPVLESSGLGAISTLLPPKMFQASHLQYESKIYASQSSQSSEKQDPIG